MLKSLILFTKWCSLNWNRCKSILGLIVLHQEAYQWCKGDLYDLTCLMLLLLWNVAHFMFSVTCNQKKPAVIHCPFIFFARHGKTQKARLVTIKDHRSSVHSGVNLIKLKNYVLLFCLNVNGSKDYFIVR